MGVGGVLPKGLLIQGLRLRSSQLMACSGVPSALGCKPQRSIHIQIWDKPPLRSNQMGWCRRFSHASFTGRGTNYNGMKTGLEVAFQLPPGREYDRSLRKRV